MESNRRRLLKLVATAGTVSVAGCSGGGDSNGEDDGTSDDGESEGEDGGSSGDSDTGGADSGGDDDDSETSDGGDDDSGTNGSSDDDSGGDNGDGETPGDSGDDESSDRETESDEQVQPGDITGTAESSVGGLEVVGHEVTGVDPQLRIELELRNVGNENNIALTHHNIESNLFDADGNDILVEQSGTRGPENSKSPGESGVVTIFLLPEQGPVPARYEISVNCDWDKLEMFSYCEN